MRLESLEDRNDPRSPHLPCTPKVTSKPEVAAVVFPKTGSHSIFPGHDISPIKLINEPHHGKGGAPQTPPSPVQRTGPSGTRRAVMPEKAECRGFRLTDRPPRDAATQIFLLARKPLRGRVGSQSRRSAGKQQPHHIRCTTSLQRTGDWGNHALKGPVLPPPWRPVRHKPPRFPPTWGPQSSDSWRTRRKEKKKRATWVEIGLAWGKKLCFRPVSAARLPALDELFPRCCSWRSEGARNSTNTIIADSPLFSPPSSSTVQSSTPCSQRRE
jgi:hypothetical protein